MSDLLADEDQLHAVTSDSAAPLPAVSVSAPSGVPHWDLPMDDDDVDRSALYADDEWVLNMEHPSENQFADCVMMGSDGRQVPYRAPIMPTVPFRLSEMFPSDVPASWISLLPCWDFKLVRLFRK